MICKIQSHQYSTAEMWQVQVLREDVQHDVVNIVVNFCAFMLTVKQADT